MMGLCAPASRSPAIGHNHAKAHPFCTSLLKNFPGECPPTTHPYLGPQGWTTLKELPPGLVKHCATFLINIRFSDLKFEQQDDLLHLQYAEAALRNRIIMLTRELLISTGLTLVIATFR